MNGRILQHDHDVGDVYTRNELLALQEIVLRLWLFLNYFSLWPKKAISEFDRRFLITPHIIRLLQLITYCNYFDRCAQGINIDCCEMTSCWR